MIKPLHIGVLGGGQLAHMLGAAAHDLPLTLHVYDPNPDSCAFSVLAHTCASFGDTQQLTDFVQRSDIVTCEFESIPATALELADQHSNCLPSPFAFGIGANRLKEKSFFTQCGMRVPAYVPLLRAEDCQQATHKVGYPLIAKTAVGGYDGKGQIRCSDQVCLDNWFRTLEVSAIAESCIAFDHEISLLVARNAEGEILAYPPVYIHQHQGVLHLAAPCPDHPLRDQATRWATRLAEELNYVGLLALELFVGPQGELYANEFAPRVHNSGHWSIEGAATSQFAQHLRAISGLPLGPVDLHDPCIMINLLGISSTTPSTDTTHVHWYGKSIRHGRKVGHITLTQSPNETQRGLWQRAEQLYFELYGFPIPERMRRICCP